MKWLKRGIVWNTDGQQPWSRSHAMGPTPFRLNASTIRVYLTTLDDEGRGRGTYVDVSAQDPTKVLRVASSPVLEVGEPGAFDDNGVMPLSIVRMPDGALYMYYSGFEICHRIRYRIFSGLAISRDNGETFERHSRTPILERSDDEMHIRGGPFVLLDNGLFRMWYVAGGSWTELEGKPMPVYEMKYAQSSDGITWPAKGITVLPITGADEHGFGRPWLVQREASSYDLFYSVRRRSFAAYRMGFAQSSDGMHWARQDDDMGIDVSDAPYETEAVMYAAVIAVDGKEYCFYNGNGFGRDGFAVAELVG
jgi:hypothetical protein